MAATVVAAQAPLDLPRTVVLAPGVFVLHNPRANESWPQGNTLVVAGDREVLVVDAGYLPGTALADIAEIRKLTDKPVRYLVNTHWHYDHTNGNGVYRAQFPGLSIVGHPETRRLLADNAPRYLASVLAPDSPVRRSVANSRKALTELGTGGDTADRGVLRRRLAQRELELAELPRVMVDPPDLLVERELTLDLGGRTVIVRHLGRANTPGDLVIYLPRDRVLATGDIVVSPIPYAYNASPGGWIEVLDEILALQPLVLVPGHGEVMRSTDYARSVQALLADVVRQVRSAFRAGKTEDEARASIDFSRYRAQFSGGDEFLGQVFDSSIVTALVARAWLEAGGGA